jgi:general secretion pathway protein G
MLTPVLVEKRYLRAIPVDPMTGDPGSWTLIPPPSSMQAGTSATPAAGTAAAAAPTGIYDVRSGASGTTRDGLPYRNL